MNRFALSNKSSKKDELVEEKKASSSLVDRRRRKADPERKTSSLLLNSPSWPFTPFSPHPSLCGGEERLTPETFLQGREQRRTGGTKPEKDRDVLQDWRMAAAKK